MAQIPKFTEIFFPGDERGIFYLKIALQDRRDRGVVPATEKVQMDQQEVELVQVDLDIVVVSSWYLFVVCFVKESAEATEKVAHRDIYHRVTVIGGGINQVGRAVARDQVVATPEVAV